MARVDVIVPVFNTSFRFLDVAFDSLRAQTFNNWKAWVINDASERTYTAELIKKLDGYGDSRFNYLYCDHKGPAGSRNVGIAQGSAPYVALLDSDDCWLPLHLVRQVSLLEEHEGLDLVHGHREIIDAEGRKMPSIAPRAGLNELSQVQLFAEMLLENFVAASSVVVRRNALERVGGFDDSFPCLVDKELWLRLLHSGSKFHHDREVVFQYRVHPQNISKKTDLLLATRRRIIDRAEDLIRDNVLLAEINWPALRRSMEGHMHREAANAYLERGKYREALKHSLPWVAGFSWPSSLLLARAAYRMLARRAAPGP